MVGWMEAEWIGWGGEAGGSSMIPAKESRLAGTFMGYEYSNVHVLPEWSVLFW